MSTAHSTPADATNNSDTPAAERDLVLYTPARAAELLAVKESWLRRKAGERAVACTFLGKHLRFSARDLRAIANLGEQPVHARPRPHRTGGRRLNG